jgi:hypothetical protein
MKEVKKHIQNWEGIHITDIPKLYKIVSKGEKINNKKEIIKK